MTDQEKIAALEARISELTTMPGADRVEAALRESGGWAKGSAVDVLVRALTATRAELSELKRSLTSELRDPNGTIWECAKREQDRADAAEKSLAETGAELGAAKENLADVEKHRDDLLRRQSKSWEKSVRIEALERVAEAARKFKDGRLGALDALLDALDKLEAA